MSPFSMAIRGAAFRTLASDGIREVRLKAKRALFGIAVALGIIHGRSDGSSNIALSVLVLFYPRL